jgi:integrase/recombinase XerD
MSDADLYQLISGKLSLDQALNQFLLTKEIEGIAAKTYQFYKSEIGYFITFAQAKGIAELEEVKPDLIRLYLQEKGKTRNKGGIHAAFRSIRAWFNWYAKEYNEDLDEWRNPILKIKIPTPRPTALPGITMDDFQALVAVCRNGTTAIRDQALFSCLLDTCARANEFLDLNINDINFHTGDVLIRAGKGDKPRYVHLGITAMKRLKRYLKGRKNLSSKDPLFLTSAGERFGYNGLTAFIRWRSQQAGIDRPGLHDFRRAGALELLRNGADLSEVSKYLGHESVEVTMRYLAITPEDIRKMHTKNSPVDNL